MPPPLRTPGAASPRTSPCRRSCSPSELLCGEILHDLFGTAADREHLRLAIDALASRAAHEARAAERLHGFVGAELHDARREVLGHGELGDEVRIVRRL